MSKISSKELDRLKKELEEVSLPPKIYKVTDDDLATFKFYFERFRQPKSKNYEKRLKQLKKELCFPTRIEPYHMYYQFAPNIWFHIVAKPQNIKLEPELGEIIIENIEIYNPRLDDKEKLVNVWLAKSILQCAASGGIRNFRIYFYHVRRGRPLIEKLEHRVTDDMIEDVLYELTLKWVQNDEEIVKRIKEIESKESLRPYV